MADKTIGELPNLPAISPLDLLVAQHNEEATKITGATLTNFFKDYIGPVAATSASQMTNTNKVYIYIGNESGYTNGNWYYYNGSSWVSGGAYNSQAVNTDATLTHEGVPADAEAAGKIVEISETQPAAPANRVWIPETQEATVQIPTWAEHEELADDISDLNSALTSEVSRVNEYIENSTTASRTYYKGDYIAWMGYFVVVTADIINTGDTISAGSGGNVSGTTLSGQLSKLYKNVDGLQYIDCGTITGGSDEAVMEAAVRYAYPLLTKNDCEAILRVFRSGAWVLMGHGIRRGADLSVAFINLYNGAQTLVSYNGSSSTFTVRLGEKTGTITPASGISIGEPRCVQRGKTCEIHFYFNATSNISSEMIIATFSGITPPPVLVRVTVGGGSAPYAITTICSLVVGINGNITLQPTSAIKSAVIDVVYTVD